MPGRKMAQLITYPTQAQEVFGALNVSNSHYGNTF